jgi:hypothetical protein
VITTMSRLQSLPGVPISATVEINPTRPIFFPHAGVVYSIMTTDRLTDWINRNESILTERQALRWPASGEGGA